MGHGYWITLIYSKLIKILGSMFGSRFKNIIQNLVSNIYKFCQITHIDKKKAQ